MSQLSRRELHVDIPGLDKLFVAGDWVVPADGDHIDVINPATENVLATVAAVGPRDIDAAVDAACRAFDDGQGAWPRMRVAERSIFCESLLREIETRMDAFVDAWVLESGATLAYSEIINRQIMPMMWRDLLEKAEQLVVEEVRSSPTGDVTLRREPVGTVLAIYAYNAPMFYVAMKVLPALLAGCTVIAKPATESQLTTRLFAEAAAAVGFPEGVLSVLPADAAGSQRLVEHPGIDMISLTAGTGVAVDALHRGADRIARFTLELGGKAAVILADDVELDAALPSIVPSALGFGGQTCVTLSRVLVPHSRADEMTEALANAYRAWVVGPPTSPDSHMGPLGVERARDRTEHYVALARKEGASVVTGGRRPPHLERGWYYEPTLLSGVDNAMQVAQEEIFGPVTAVIPYADLDDAVRIANDSKYGLAASVYAADRARAIQVARCLRVGAVSVNVSGNSVTEPFGGFKQSGYGREFGLEGIQSFTEMKQYVLGAGSLWNAEG